MRQLKTVRQSLGGSLPTLIENAAILGSPSEVERHTKAAFQPHLPSDLPVQWTFETAGHRLLVCNSYAQVRKFSQLMADSAALRSAVDSVPSSHAPDFVEMLIGLASEVCTARHACLSNCFPSGFLPQLRFHSLLGLHDCAAGCGCVQHFLLRRGSNKRATSRCSVAIHESFKSVLIARFFLCNRRMPRAR